MHKTRDPSPAQNKPALHLAAGIVRQAILDFQSKDTVKALDSFVWFLDGKTGAAFFMDALDLPTDPDVILWRLTRERHTR